VGARPGVRHGQHAHAVELQLRRALVLERLAPDRLPAAAGAGRVAALDHEVRDDAVEDDAVVVAVFDVGDEILASERSDLRVELELDLALRGFQFDSGLGHGRMDCAPPRMRKPKTRGPPRAQTHTLTHTPTHTPSTSAI